MFMPQRLPNAAPPCGYSDDDHTGNGTQFLTAMNSLTWTPDPGSTIYADRLKDCEIYLL